MVIQDLEKDFIPTTMHTAVLCKESGSRASKKEDNNKEYKFKLHYNLRSSLVETDCKSDCFQKNDQSSFSER